MTWLFPLALSLIHTHKYINTIAQSTGRAIQSVVPSPVTTPLLPSGAWRLLHTGALPLCSTLPYLTLSFPTCPILPYPTLPYPTLLYPTLPYNTRYTVMFVASCRALLTLFTLCTVFFFFSIHFCYTHLLSFPIPSLCFQFMDISEDELRKEVKDVSLPRIQGKYSHTA